MSLALGKRDGYEISPDLTGVEEERRGGRKDGLLGWPDIPFR